MKISIIGTRGIPNQYGGFEQFLMNFSKYLVDKGHDVTVYSISNHPYQKAYWNGVKIIHKWNPENYTGAFGQFIYDLLCILHVRKKTNDVILQLGFTSSSVWSFLFPKKTTIVTNMDGLEWKRSKYNFWIKSFLKKAEYWAVQNSDFLIADSLGIQEYLKKKYQISSKYIPYGSDVFNDPDKNILKKYGLSDNEYCLLIARIQPDNNVETIIKGFLLSGISKKLIVVGSCQNKFGSMLLQKYQSERIIFLGSIFDRNILDNLRYFCYFYFHGHSVGGTNPSLIEAMSCRTSIIAHNNIFNRSILEDHAYYFSNEIEISKILLEKNPSLVFKENNYEKVEKIYSLENIHSETEKFLLSCINQ
ncbi:DUF1972 domain-containing protein [Chryseobacterium sp. EO14]|uniref:DUF1972 domain-containing protein n=1 Tax=Chryseobacterium sp. EO14 TaxID=2950551 RepID=UPI002108AA8C|nr:DUF1972 domain-containing protein [Chryseobacterium sp. EO14]MCQ4142447.1 DUF1972 domain-containing protein [Chryseobacterium sp. EO14]